MGDLVIFIFCTLLYLGYHLFYFVDGTVRIPGLPPRAALWSITKINRCARGAGNGGCAQQPEFAPC